MLDLRNGYNEDQCMISETLPDANYLDAMNFLTITYGVL